MAGGLPPPDVVAAAAIVERWVQQAEGQPAPSGGKVSEEQFAKMSPAQRLDYVRGFDQTQFQKDPPR